MQVIMDQKGKSPHHYFSVRAKADDGTKAFHVGYVIQAGAGKSPWTAVVKIKGNKEPTLIGGNAPEDLLKPIEDFIKAMRG